jgi:ATP-dependent Zn protease
MLILLWIVLLLSAVAAFGFALLAGLGLPGAIVFALADMLVLRGVFSYIRRWLALHELRPDEPDPMTRTVETNRYIFWRRFLVVPTGIALVFLAIVGLVAVPAYFMFGIPPLVTLIVALNAILALVVRVPQYLFIFLVYMLLNFSILIGPFVLYGRMGRQVVQPGDADYDVKVEDVRGQKSAVDEMGRILRLIEQGRNFVRAGGKRERGVLMVGPPGTGKTMLAKGIASTLHSPIVITSGAAFAGMFLGMDVLNVFMMVRAAKKKAKRWGGCLIFIDEFDALGSRRSGMGGGMPGMGGMMGGLFGGGQMGLNMLLVLMDGVDNPGFFRKGLRRAVNLTLDGLFVPRRIGVNGSGVSLRIPQIKPPRYNLLFMGATNRPGVLDEAVTRPGRFGRQIIFRMPTREDRKDIAALYFDAKKHDPELDTPARRDEFARVTEGYSPAMIEQALSLALMYAFEDGRESFNWRDLREAMGNIEMGLAEPVEYSEREKLATARHELGHAVAARFFEPQKRAVRLSIRMRGGSLGHHSNVEDEERFTHFRSNRAGRLRVELGALAAERVFYGENSSGVTMDLIQATDNAAHIVGVWGMGPEQLDSTMSRKAADFGEYLISCVEAVSVLGDSPSSPTAAALRNPLTRRTIAQVIGAAYIDCWRLMYVNRDAIDLAAEALMQQGELRGDEIEGLLDSVNLRAAEDGDPYPEALPHVPRIEPESRPEAATA